MKKLILLILVLLAISNVKAQDDFGIPTIKPKQIFNVCNCAPYRAYSAIFNVDVYDTLNSHHGDPVLPVTASNMYISIDDQESWVLSSLSILGTTDYENTYVTSRPITDDFYYYTKIETDSTITTESPCNFSEVFPPTDNLMANINSDPTGDQTSITIGGSTYSWANCDLTNFRAGYSEDKIYFQARSNGGFATSHNDIYLRRCGSDWLGYDQTVDVYHIYGFPILNDNSLYPDSIVYAVIYGDLDISFLGIGINITPGVYKISIPGSGAAISDMLDAYERISSSSTFGYNISGNTLNLWLDKSILTSDPDFGDFPEDQNFVTGCGIASAYLMQSGCVSIVPDTFAYVIHDFSKNTNFYMRTHQDNISENIQFSLSSRSATAYADNVQFSILYTDDDNNLPIQKQLQIGGCYPGVYEMSTSDHLYSDGAIFTETVVTPIVNKIPYRFLFHDGMCAISTDWDTLTTDLTYIDITINDGTSYTSTIDDIYHNEQALVSDIFEITNTGTSAIDLGLTISSISSSTGRDFTANTEPSINQFAIYALLNDSEIIPESGLFELGETITSSSTMWCDGVSFFGGGNLVKPECYDCVFSTTSEMNEKIWLNLYSPTSISEPHEDQDINIVLQVQTRNHLP